MIIWARKINWKSFSYRNENTTCKQSALRFFPLSTKLANMEAGEINGIVEFVIELPLEAVDDVDDVVVGVALF